MTWISGGLWLAALLLPTAACASDLDEQVLEVVRRGLLEQAQGNGLIAPEVQVTLPQRVPRPPCPGGWELGTPELRHLSRLRLRASCADGRTPAQDYLLRATLSADVLVATQNLRAGEAIGAEQLQLQRRDVSQLPDAISALEAVAGLAPRSSVRAGQVLQKRALQPALLVRRGDVVLLEAQRDGIRVQASAEALESGARDALIRVRNLASGRTVAARVIDAGVVEPVEAPAR